MGLANWVVGKMVDSFLAQPPAEKAAVFETMATKFWEAATPEESAEIARLLLPRFLDEFLRTASAEQKAELLSALLDPGHLESMTKEMLPGLATQYLQDLSPEAWRKLMPAPMSGMGGMPGAGKAEPRSSGKPERPKPPNPGGMMPW